MVSATTHGEPRPLEPIEKFFAPLNRTDVGVAIGSTRLRSAEACLAELYPAELFYVARSVQKRRLEFALGRSLARQALRSIGLLPVEILAGADRAPMWPTGVVGSITHCDDIGVAAVAAATSGIKMIGIDVERIAPVSDLVEMITTISERRAPWFSQGTNPNVLASLCFSAKESAYKALYPCLRRILDFQDVELILNFSTSSFTAGLATHVVGYNDGATCAVLNGRFLIGNEFVMTYATA